MLKNQAFARAVSGWILEGHGFGWTPIRPILATWFSGSGID